MDKSSKSYLILNLPDTPKYVIHRSWAGSFGTAEIKTNQQPRRFLPIWMIYGISAFLNKKVPFTVIDAQAEDLNNTKTLERIRACKPDVIITLICLPSYHNDILLINNIKESMPHTKILLLGGLAHIEYEKMLKESNADYIIQGRFPFYNNIVSYLSDGKHAEGLVYLKNNEIIKGPLLKDTNDLNFINFNSYDIIDIDHYILSAIDNDGKDISWVPILHGAGCPYKCTYCAYPIAYGTKIHYKDISIIIDEIEYIIKKYKIHGFCLRDVVFTKERERVKDFCKKINEKELSIRFFFETRIGLLDEELIAILKKAGCFQMNIGVESGSPDILKKVGKPGININLLKETFQFLDAAGINTMAHIIIGLPGENKKTVNQTYKLLKKIHASEVNINFITPYPGTKFYEYAKNNNLILDYDWNHYTSHNLVMRSEELSGEALYKLGRKMQKKLFLNKLIHDKKFRKTWLKNML